MPDSHQGRWHGVRRALRVVREQFGSAADQFTAGPRDASLHEEPGARANRQLLWADGFVSNISESFVASFLNPFVMALGATNGQIGLLSSLNNLSAAAGLIPGARLAEHFQSRKLVAAISGGVFARIVLLLLAVLPLFVEMPTLIYAVIMLVALRSFFSQMGFPAWSTLVADLVPEAIRGRYFSARNIGLAIAALGFTPIAGWIIQAGGGVRGYQLGLVLAGLIGFVATVIFVRIKEPERVAPSRAAQSKRSSLVSVARENPQFAGFTAVALLWNLALMVAGPFFSVYLVRNLGATPVQIGVLAAVNSMGNILGQRFWGGLNDRRGARWVMGVSGLLIPLIPVIWSLAPGPWWLIPVEIFSGFMWAGYSLSNFNLLLTITPPSQRERYVALYHVAVYGAAFVGPLVGSVLANNLGIRSLLWLSAGGRLVASALFMVVMRRRPEPLVTSDAIC